MKLRHYVSAVLIIANVAFYIEYSPAQANDIWSRNVQHSDRRGHLDPAVVALTKAIEQFETGGDYTAIGKSGEYGAYQYTFPTWTADSKIYLGKAIPLAQATPAQQDEVAYKKIQDLKRRGYSPAQIASIWNSGKPDWEGTVGINTYGVKYDTPSYVFKVGKTYQTILEEGL